jgi:UPF0755 protein
MTKRKILVAFIIVFSVLLSSFSFYFYQVLYTPNILVGREDAYIHIPTGASFKDVQNILYDEHYVQDLVAFSVLARVRKYDRGVKPGRYLLKKDMGNLEALNVLRAGRQSPINITFNNIRLKEDLAEKICKYVEADAKEFAALLDDEAFLEEYGFSPENVMGMFIPNTYEVYWTIKARELFDRMHYEYNRFWNDERLTRAKEINLSPKEVSVLASIVMAESNKADESPVIAGVYINRLRRGIPLQADPTVVFAIGDFSMKRVLKKHTEIDSPYNTYKYRGLPPGPINLPSIQAIDAVLYYKEHKYLYFCAKEDFSGYHNFATNLEQHNKNAQAYQRALNKARLFK